LAIVGKAAYLVSGDRDLLSFGGELNSRVLAPDGFVSRFADSP
jgi:predicted nucleic acid-binding protein